MDEDLRIIERVLAGNAQAFRELVEAHQRQVFQFVFNMLPRVQDAEDLTQDVFVAAFQNLASYRACQARFSTWLLTIARNRCCNSIRRRQMELPGDLDQPAPGPLPEESATQRELWQQLSGALEKLPLAQRTAFVLAEIQNLPYSEIAAIEGIEVGTVKSRVGRARDRLRQILKSWRPAGQRVLTEGGAHEP